MRNDDNESIFGPLSFDLIMSGEKIDKETKEFYKRIKFNI